MKPINDNMRNYGSGNSQLPSGKKSYLGIIILIIILVIYFSNSDENTQYVQETNQPSQNDYITYEGYDYSKPSEYASQDSVNLYEK